MVHKYNYLWTLKDAVFTKDKGSVFSCFACGGGSTMGYKLAGFNVLGFNEIDPRMAECYIANHSPLFSYVEDIRTFKMREDLPQELYNLDILDGSPPCSSFSMAGAREEGWGKKKNFREGQTEQVLDTLFFDFIDLAKKLQPKIVVAENVKGLILGNAKIYVKKIAQAFDDAGYYCKLYLFDASKMGVPQKRERVFFICIRKDLLDKCQQIPKDAKGAHILDFKFNEPEIAIKSFLQIQKKTASQNYTESRFGDVMLDIKKASPTIATINRYWVDENNLIDKNTILKIGSYPVDYNFLKQQPQYLVGMSVPPVMTAQIADKIYEQILSKL